MRVFCCIKPKNNKDKKKRDIIFEVLKDPKVKVSTLTTTAKHLQNMTRFAVRGRLSFKIVLEVSATKTTLAAALEA